MARKLVAVLTTVLLGTVTAGPAQAAPSYKTISGSGSTWAQTAIDAWRANVAQYGLTVNYGGLGSSVGRSQFKDSTVDFAGSDIPYGITDSGVPDPPPSRGYAYVMDVAGGTAFMYNLKIGARRVTNLRLSGENIAKIFTGVLTKWNDPAIKADNPGLTLPAIPIVPVVRSDGSGATAHFTEWMIAKENKYWTDFCARTHRNPCTETSTYPAASGIRAQPQDQGVSGYVAQAESVGAIGYVQYSYAISAGFPVAKMLNDGGYYTEPTPGHVAVALLKAKINLNKNSPTYLAQDLSQVYTDTDPRAYPLSNYSYMVVPADATFDSNKGYTLGTFVRYALCQGQSQVNALGYSALPINLVQAGLGQVPKINGAGNVSVNIKGCNNPTFSADGSNTLARTDPYPPACDKRGPTQCSAGTGGSKNQSTPVNPNAQGPGGSTSNGTTGGGTTGGGSNSGSTGGGSGSGGPNGSNGPGSTTGRPGGPGTSGAAPAAACDPDSGACNSTEGSNGQNPGQVDASPVSTATSLGDGLRVTLMILAAVLLLGLTLGPPLIARATGRHRREAGS